MRISLFIWMNCLRSNSKLFKDLQIYIKEKEIEDIDKYRPFTDEELDTYDLLDGD